ncbi:helix-turn-helix domain-containing protein [Actinomycetospora termitidis]|uniref:Helix-turn-helix transcriptional regulator n=1 Tax=Actinomycetospora termitidis TaxID=3053470 RepID=A0ABT7MI21_9PSEU|nr:helix-turn-helix transcriptional regulator [Actinomycetospora sp. Odt1-22]MDL5159582.1 helix-turn-helix transcriptional regulator [Actinomycetospora sp. Odt1-22]
MPRPQRELDPAGGPLVEFARDLRALREAAGSPKFTTMARRTGRSKTALADASAGRHLPRWETVEDYVRACDADPAPWRARWDALRSGGATPAAEEPSSDVSDVPSPAPGDDQAARASGAVLTSGGSTASVPAPAPRSRRRVVAAVAATTAVVAIALGFVLGRLTVPAPPVEPQTVEAIEVQNKVALGADRLVEDRTPAYLSTEALSYCASPSRSCKVPGTEMVSGAAVVANCWTTGQMMWNVDLADPDQARNPDRVQSDLWYRASFPDGRTGYLSEVYVVRGDRGGRGLPRCTP